MKLVASVVIVTILVSIAFAIRPAGALVGPLGPGWNLVGGPGVTPAEYFDAHGECADVDIYGWHGPSQTFTHWFSYVPDYVNSPAAGGIEFMPSTDGFWVNCRTVAVQDLAIAPPKTPVPNVTEAAHLAQVNGVQVVQTPYATLTPTPSWGYWTAKKPR